MAVGAKQREVFRLIVPPVAIDMLDLNWYSSGNGMAFRPATPRARLNTQITYDELPKE